MAHCGCPKSASDQSRRMNASHSNSFGSYENKCSTVSAAEVSGAQSAAATKACDHGLVVKRGTDFREAQKITEVFKKEYEYPDCGDGFVTKFHQSVEITRKPSAKNDACYKAFDHSHHHIDSSRPYDHENSEVEWSKQQHVMKQTTNEESAAHVLNCPIHKSCGGDHRAEVDDDQHSKQQLLSAVKNSSQNCQRKDYETERQQLKKKMENAIQMMSNSSPSCHDEEYEYGKSRLNVNEQNFIKKMMQCDEVRSQKWLRERADLEDLMIKALHEMKMQGMKISDEKSFLQKISQKSKMQGDRIAESNFHQHQAHEQRMKGHYGGFYICGEVTIDDMEPCNMGMQKRMVQRCQPIVAASTDPYNNGGAYNAGGGGCYTTPGKPWY